MEQLLLHLFGDYILQTNWMAKHKTKYAIPALLHAFTYALPFLLLKPSALAWMVIFVSHFLIDRYRLARYVAFAKNWINEPSIKWEDYSETGYDNQLPKYMSFWLLIITDNTCHLLINYAALRWL